MKKTIGITTIFLAMATAIIKAQPPNLDSVKMELYKVNRVFDSSQYLGFDVSVVYSTDTLYGKYEHEEMNGKYILNNRNLYYKMGNMEYAQNDSFVYSIYHDEKMMVMTKDIIASSSSLFPLKEFVDSIITWYDTLYTITLRDEEDFKVIEFTATTSGLPYQRFAVYYDAGNYYPEKFEMSLREGLNGLDEIPDSIASLIKQKPVEKKITMSFSNYYNPETLEVFETQRYVYFDRLRKKFRPVEKFRAYRFIANGVDGEEYDESIELEPPADNNNNEQ